VTADEDRILDKVGERLNSTDRSSGIKKFEGEREGVKLNT